MITAKEAREISEKVIEARIQGCMENYLSKGVQEAANNGEFSYQCNLRSNHQDELVKRLEAIGYKVTTQYPSIRVSW